MTNKEGNKPMENINDIMSLILANRKELIKGGVLDPLNHPSFRGWVWMGGSAFIPGLLLAYPFNHIENLHKE